MRSSEYIWLNNEMVPLAQGRISVNDRGFLYGDGFFETLRAENGRPQFLAEHVNRLEASARAFRIAFPGDVNWRERLEKLLSVNGLGDRLAAVKILLTRGQAPALGLPTGSQPTLVIWARLYDPPSPEAYATGWPVVTFPEGRSTFLGRHKSLNYLFYLAARQYALDQGAQEALVLESDGLVSEGAATSIIFLKAGRFCTPRATSALPGVTVTVLGRALNRRHADLEPIPITLAELQQAEGIWLANSLMGLMPVSSVDGNRVTLSFETTHFLQACLSSEAEL